MCRTTYDSNLKTVILFLIKVVFIISLENNKLNLNILLRFFLILHNWTQSSTYPNHIRVLMRSQVQDWISTFKKLKEEGRFKLDVYNTLIPFHIQNHN